MAEPTAAPAADLRVPPVPVSKDRVRAYLRASPEEERAYQPQAPSRPFDAVRREFPTFDAYLERYLKPGSGRDLNLTEALIFHALDCVPHGMSGPFDPAGVEQAIYDAANEIGQALAHKHHLVGLSEHQVQNLPSEEKKAIIETINGIFFRHFSTIRSMGRQLQPGDDPALGHAPWDTRTVAESVAEQGGYCEDLSNVYMCVIQILKGARIELPIHFCAGPGHTLVAWEDRALHERFNSVKHPRFLIELTVQGGLIQDSDLLYRQNLGWRPERTTGCLQVQPVKYGLGAELDSRVNAFLNRATKKEGEGDKAGAEEARRLALKDARRVVSLSPLGTHYFNLYLASRSDNDRLSAITHACILEPSRKHYLHRAIVIEEAASKAAGVKETAFILRQAVEDCDRALRITDEKKPETELEELLSDTSDKALRRTRNRILMRIMFMTRDEKYGEYLDGKRESMPPWKDEA